MMKGKSASRFPPVTVVLFVIVVVVMIETWITPTAARSVVERKTSATNNKQDGANRSDGFRVPRSVHKIVAEGGKEAELSCPIASRTSQHVEWYKQNPNGRGTKRITQFRNRYELSGLGTMKIHALTFEDGGTYFCKVANKSDVHSTQLVVSGEESTKNNHLKPHPPKKGSNEQSGEEVYSEPQILRNLLPKEKVYHVAKGFPILLLKCESSGNPQPTITWYKNGEIISSSTTNVSTLKLLNISLADNGLYKCESINMFGSSQYEVTIQMTDYWFGAAEILNLSPRNITVYEGGVVNISCTAQFELEPWFAWVRKVTNNKTESSKVFFHSGTDSYYEVLKSTLMKARGEGVYSTELMITNVTRNYSGVYYCAVAGLQGFNLSDATIVVESNSVRFFSVNGKGIAAQWAILWTVSFVFLVMAVIVCFVKLYGCRQSKQNPKPLPVPKSHCNLPESSPLTMSTHCTATQGKESFVPLMVGSCSGLSSYVEGFEYDDLSPSAPNSFIYPPSQLASSSWASSSSSTNDCESLRSYRPNSMCSDYHCNSSINKPPASSCRVCCHRMGAGSVHHQYRTTRQQPCRVKKKRQVHNYSNNMQSSWGNNSHYSSYDANYCLSTTDCESCESEIVHTRHKKVYPHVPLEYIYDYSAN